jgi:type VI secretion system protein ImpB
MPLVKVIRKPITANPRKVPTSTCAVVMPMTLDGVGNEVKSEIQTGTAF